jgi:thymidylate kinase
VIIEIFGAPGVGKSTFARALAARLQERGSLVQLVASYRPAESPQPCGSALNDPVPKHMTAALRRVTRPVVEMLATGGDLLGNAPEAGTAAELMRLLPPRSIVWSIRLHQYILRLLRSWRLASAVDGIVLFDQGFVQAICSLVVLGRMADRNRIVHALASIPAPDLLIHLTAPDDVLAARLRERERQQGKIERLFELDLQTNLAFVRVIAELDDLLRTRGHHIAYADCSDRDSLSDEVERLADETGAMLRRETPVTA